jgi:hypothetical protein
LVRKAVDSVGFLYIFQLAAINGLRMWGSVFHFGFIQGREDICWDQEPLANGIQYHLVASIDGDQMVADRLVNEQ